MSRNGTGGPYGYCPCAQPYDDACSKWAAAGGSLEALQDAKEYQRHSAGKLGMGLEIMDWEAALIFGSWKSII